MKFGCHISIRKGYSGAAHTAYAIGAGSFQYFPKNPRSLGLKQFDARDAEACARFCRERGIVSIAHTAYPANLAVGDPDLREAVAASIINDLHIVEACGSVGLVVHFGKYKGKDPLQGYKNSIECLNIVLSGYEGSALVLIENQAGEGTDMGMTFEECVQLRKLCNRPESVGFCLDTCHLFAGGYYTGDNAEELAERGRSLGYFKHLKAIHCNDSVYGPGSRRDRHANIGSGRIGEAGIRRLLVAFAKETEREGADLPVVLETPAPAGGSHQPEIELLKRLASGLAV